MGRRSLLRLALSLPLLGTACASPTPRNREVSFPPGRHVVRRDGVRLELLQATYDARGVSLLLGVKNGGDTPIVIERDGILLAHEQLEFPIAGDPAPTIAPLTTVLPHTEVKLAASFALGHRLEDDAVLRVRIARRGADFIDGLAVVVPPGVRATDEVPPPEQP